MSRVTHTGRTRWLAGWCLAPLLCLGAFAVIYATLGAPATGIDDAEITAVYARNIAQGLGYVYTAGGERVEGSTSLAWTLLMAAHFAVGFESLRPLFAVTLLLCMVAVFACLAVARRASEEANNEFVAVGVLVASPVFFLWMLGTLMDTVLWCASLAVAAALAIVPRTTTTARLLPAALAWLVLVRPEALVVAPALAGLHALGIYLRGAAGREALRALAMPLLAIAGVAGALVWFRLGYFGYPQPNTYYSKVGGDRVHTAIEGVRYVYRALRDQPLYGIGFLLTLLVFVRDGGQVWQRVRGRSATVSEPALTRWLVSLLVLGGFALPLVAGMDHFWGYRMLQPFAPWLAVILAATLTMQWRTLGHGAKIGVVCVALLLTGHAWTQYFRDGTPQLRAEIQLGVDGRKVAKLLAHHLPPDDALPSLGVTAAGGIAFAYPGRVYDLLGLNWVAMAHAHRDRRGDPGHAAFSGEVFWSEPATLVLPGFRAEAPQNACDLYSEWEDTHYHGLLSSERFRAEYAGLSLPTAEGLVAMYARRDYLARHPSLTAHVLEWPSHCDAFPAEPIAGR